MTSSITKSTISLWDTLPKEIADEIMEFNKPPFLDELKDKLLLKRIYLQRLGESCPIAPKVRCRVLDKYKVIPSWVRSMGWKEKVGYMKQMCKENGIKGYSKKNKNQLINILMKM